VIEARVFDHTAIIALFRGNERAFQLWQLADSDQLTLIMPAVAVAEANYVIGATSSAWRPILDPGRVIVTPLDESTAIDTGPASGTLVVRQVVWEARQVQGEIMTQAPWQYPETAPPIWVL
jgi:hypothetical protein